MLSLEQKISIFSSFPELKRKDHSQKRVSFEFNASRRKGYVLAYELAKSGNGYVCGKYLSSDCGYTIDPQDSIKIKDFTEDELRSLIKTVIKSMSA